MLRGAVIGLGNVAVHGHLPGWLGRRDVEIVAATDASPGRRPLMEAHLPGRRWYDSSETLLAEEALDFVDICTPPATHAGLIGAALRRGLHVLCEKPLVCRMQELVGLAELAAETDRALCTVHNWHHAPIIRFVRDLLKRGAIGEVTRVRWRTLRTKPAVTGDGQGVNWRLDPAMAGGGILVDHGWHVFYVLHGWLEQAPVRVNARLETRRHTQYPLEDTATVRLEFPHAAGEVFLTWAADVRQTGADLEGTRGVLHVEDDTVVLREHGSGRPEQRWTFPSSLSEGSHHPDWFGGVADGFVAGMTDRVVRRDNLAQASLCVALLTMAQESDRQGEAWLPIEDARRSVCP
jgi:predicted dehydrogenase